MKVLNFNFIAILLILTNILYASDHSKAKTKHKQNITKTIDMKTPVTDERLLQGRRFRHLSDGNILGTNSANTLKIEKISAPILKEKK